MLLPPDFVVDFDPKKDWWVSNFLSLKQLTKPGVCCQALVENMYSVCRIRGGVGPTQSWWEVIEWRGLVAADSLTHSWSKKFWTWNAVLQNFDSLIKQQTMFYWTTMGGSWETKGCLFLSALQSRKIQFLWRKSWQSLLKAFCCFSLFQK